MEKKLFRIAIVDDERCILDEEKKAILSSRLDIPIEICTYLKGKLLLYDLQEGKRFETYMIDIEMPLINGLDLAKKIRKIQFDATIIFVTGHSEFAISSYDLEIKAYYYLLKESFEERIGKIMKKIVQEYQQKRFYTIETQVRFERIACEDILYIFKEGKNAVIITRKGEHRERITLEKIYEKLNMPELVFLERGKIVNMRYITKIIRNNAYLENGDIFEISRANIRKVKSKIARFWGDNL